MILATGNAIRAWRALTKPPTTDWVDWAVAELEAGRDGPNLRIVAGLREPYHYSEVTRFVDNALVEAGVPPLAKDEAVAAYARDLVSALIQESSTLADALSLLASLCIETGYTQSLMPFYLLHFARLDLHARNDQHYWPGATSLNIDEIVRTEASAWLEKSSRAA